MTTIHETTLLTKNELSRLKHSKILKIESNGVMVSSQPVEKQKIKKHIICETNSDLYCNPELMPIFNKRSLRCFNLITKRRGNNPHW